MTALLGIDPLTGVEDRGALDRALNDLLKASAGESAAVMIIDLDHFKRINDGPGHIAGDEALRSIGGTLRRLVNRYTAGRTFRFGGDEFVVVLRGYSPQETDALARTIAEAVGHLTISGISHPLTLSIGTANSPPVAVSDLLSSADQALLHAKRSGRNRIEAFSPESRAQAAATRRLILNPQLFDVLDKTLRLAFVRTERYHKGVEYIEQHRDLPLKCVSVLGPTDLLVVHLADRDHRFLADLKPLLDVADGGDPHSLQYFEVTTIWKYHSHMVPAGGSLPRQPDRTTLKELAELADGRGIDGLTEERLQQLKRLDFAINVESTTLREAEIEAYITVNMLGGRTDIVAPDLFRQVINEYLLPDPHVVSIFEGRGNNANMQYVLRTRSTPPELFDFIETLHTRCSSRMLPRIQTTTYMVVRTKPLRLHRSLLIPPLTAEQKRTRDVVIMPILEENEQLEFLFADQETHDLLIAQVARLDDAFRSLSIPTTVLTTKEQLDFRRASIRAVVTADIRAIRNVYGDLIATVEPALRDLAVSSVRENFPELAHAVKERIISQAAANKELATLTLGEVRDILRAFHRQKHPAADTLPSLEFLDKLQPAIDMRNKLTHGEKVKPEDATRVLADFVQLMTSNASQVFADGSNADERDA